MVDISAAAAPAVSPAPARQPWPSRGVAYYGLTVIILATMLNFFDAQLFGMMAQRIKIDFSLTDEQVGFLIGPANIIFYVLVGIPMARLVDMYPRKYVLAAGIAVIGSITALGGLAQSFTQLFSSRMLVGAGGSAHAPGAYSMLADYFPPAKVPRAIGFLQLGFIGGNTLGIVVGGQLISMAAAWPVSHWMGLDIHGWQWILMLVGLPGLVISALLLLAREPARRGAVTQGKALPLKVVLRELRTRKGIYLPMFIGLGLSAATSAGFLGWRTPFLIRTYGWTEAQIGRWSGLVFLISSIIGAVLGTLFVEWLSRRHKDANLRAATICFAIAGPFEILSALMPSAPLSIAFLGVAGVCGLASAVPQNAAIQRITPNELRGQVTAIYLFMYIAFGALGSQLIGSITLRVFHSDSDLWKSMVLTAAVLMPIATLIMSRGIKPYGREVTRLDALEAAGST